MAHSMIDRKTWVKVILDLTHSLLETVYQIILMNVLFGARGELIYYAILTYRSEIVERLSDGEALSLVTKCNLLSVQLADSKTNSISQ